MDKEKRIIAPEGYVIKAIDIINGEAVITFMEEERKLPKTWEEFCEMYPIKADECYIDALGRERRIREDENLLPDRATAEAILALCQLIQLRDCYNKGWKPDWKRNNDKKYLIKIEREEIGCDDAFLWASSPLFFKSAELRDEFLRNFRQLIEKTKPLYGIKEGGEE